MIERLLERSLANRKVVYPLIREEAIEIGPVSTEIVKDRYMQIQLKDMVDRLEEREKRVTDQSAFVRDRLY